MRVPARSKSAARDRYVGFLQQTLSCVTSVVWIVAPTRTGDGLLLQLSEDAVRLPVRDRDPLWLQATQDFHFERDHRFGGEWKVKTDGYAYTIAATDDLSQELFAWHWHPNSRPDTHLHVGRRHPELGSVGKMHVPCGRVAMEEVALFAIHDLGVVPQRDDRQSILQDSLIRFRQYRTWV